MAKKKGKRGRIKKKIKVTKSILKEIYEDRPEESHKDDFGRLLVIGGNKKYSGSPIFNSLSAIAAYKSGVDIVEVVAPERAARIVASFSPDMITYPLEGDYIKKSHLKTLLKESKNKKAFIIGGGLGRKRTTLATVREYLERINIPGIIDADAIYALEGKNKEGIDLSNFVITPHSYEFKILTGEALKIKLKDRIKQVKEMAKELNTTLLVKGSKDIIANSKEVAVNTTGNPYMTVGGTGDTLAGILGGLVAQGNNLLDSAKAAAYINGKAGSLVGKKTSMTASELVEKIPKVVD